MVLVVPRSEGAFALVAHRQNAAAIIDTTSNTLVATVAKDSGDPDIAITPNGASAYVTGAFGNLITVIDTATQT